MQSFGHPFDSKIGSLRFHNDRYLSTLVRKKLAGVRFIFVDLVRYLNLVKFFGKLKTRILKI